MTAKKVHKKQVQILYLVCSSTFPSISGWLVVSKAHLKRIFSDLICICFSCHVLMPLFQRRWSSNSANCRHNLSSRGAWVVHTPPQNNHWWIHSANQFSPLPAHNSRCSKLVDNLAGRGTLTEYLCGGQYRYKGITQPSLMEIIIFKQQLKTQCCGHDKCEGFKIWNLMWVPVYQQQRTLEAIAVSYWRLTLATLLLCFCCHN